MMVDDILTGKDTEEELALISLYSTLVEEEKFTLDLEKDIITPHHKIQNQAKRANSAR